jgi:hypothetical protein
MYLKNYIIANILRLVRCPEQYKRIAPLPFFHGKQKATTGLAALTPEMDYNGDGLNTSHVCSISHS